MPSERILVVDDDPAILSLLEVLLRRERYQVDTASGGRDALSKIELTRYDVIVLDLMMPEVSGFEVLKRLHVRDPQIKCVVVVSAGSEFEVVHAITPNVFTSLRKPFDIQALVTAVQKCIEAGCEPAVPPAQLPPVVTAA